VLGIIVIRRLVRWTIHLLISNRRIPNRTGKGETLAGDKAGNHTAAGIAITTPSSVSGKARLTLAFICAEVETWTIRTNGFLPAKFKEGDLLLSGSAATKAPGNQQRNHQHDFSFS